ncbi:MAG: hypothetical protein OIF57_19885 [Marinobacterium sp.]|nr:hypothetical protein [Marinobacterium sp.]
MDLMIRELDQLRLCCTQPGIAVSTGEFEQLSVFELEHFFQRRLEQGQLDRVVEGLSWLFCHARSPTLRTRIDPLLQQVLLQSDADTAWRLACLFATGCGTRTQWDWSHLIDSQRVLLCLEYARLHPKGKAWLDYYWRRQELQSLDPAEYAWLPLVLDGIRQVFSFRQPAMLCLLERLIRCGSLSAWELFQQVCPVSYRLQRWLDAMYADPFPFSIAGMYMPCRTRLLRWALLKGPEQLAVYYIQTDRRQWFALLQLLDPQTRFRVVEQVWQRYGDQSRL